MARYVVRSNGAGGYCVTQKRNGINVKIGSECSHRRNADIKAARLNGDIDDGQDWKAFYRT